MLVTYILRFSILYAAVSLCFCYITSLAFGFSPGLNSDPTLGCFSGDSLSPQKRKEDESIRPLHPSFCRSLSRSRVYFTIFGIRSMAEQYVRSPLVKLVRDGIMPSLTRKVARAA